MSTSLATKATLSFMPLAIGVLLQTTTTGYSNIGTRRKSSDLVPLHLEELMYNKAFTVIRVSLLFLSKQNLMDSATKCVPSLISLVSSLS